MGHKSRLLYLSQLIYRDMNIDIECTLKLNHFRETCVDFEPVMVQLCKWLQMNINDPTAGRGGLVVGRPTAVREDPGKSHRGRSCLSRQSLRYTALGTGCAPLLQCLGRLSLPPSVGR